MALPVTVVTVAFGSPDVVGTWINEWSDTGASCIISDNGNLMPASTGNRARVLPFTGNEGFGAGINRAVLESDSPVVLITNPDTLPRSAESLSNLLDYHTRGSITGALTVDSSGKEVHSTGIWPDRAWVKSQVFRQAENLWREDQIDWLQGSLMMVHRDDFLRIGGFSSRFPLYFEDVDVCSRGRKQGMNIDYFKQGGFIHDEGSGSDQARVTRLSCYHWGLLEFFRNHDPGNAEVVRKMIIAKCILRSISYAVVDVKAARGYYRALLSVLKGVAPKLPGSVNG